MNLPRYLLTALFICFLTAAVSAQDRFAGCGTEELHAQRAAADPKYRRGQEQLDRDWAARRRLRGRKKSAPPYVLPLAFHVVHQNGPENISDAAILRAVDFVNDAFANRDYFDQGTGTDTDLQFCLARRTPDNLATSGITRTVSALTDLRAVADDRALKDLQRWSPREYINVWVVKEICGLGLSCGVAGYAYYPSAHGGQVDGIVVEARWLAGDAAKASVLVHELGHYLGLRHTFAGGCKNDDCTSDGDAVCDTPPDGSKAAVPCSGSANTCSTDTDSGFATDQDDMFINYMDYGYFRCYSAFTPGQRDRMHFFLEGRRRSLLGSLACSPPCPAPVTAAFSGGDVTVEAGTTLTFTNGSTNAGSYAWKINGTTFATTATASRAFPVEGGYDITLVATNGDPLCAADSVRQRVTVVCSVTADFTGPAIVYAGRDTVFTRQATNATAYSWTVDGAAAGAGPALNYRFPAPGAYQLCLTAASAGCQRERCRTVFVAEPPCATCPAADSCDLPFLQRYQTTGDALTQGQFTAIRRAGATTFVAGPVNGTVAVLALRPDGEIRWQRAVPLPGVDPVVTALRVDAEGFLAGIGHYQPANGGGPASFAFRTTAATGAGGWANTYAEGAGGRFLAFAEAPGNTDRYLVVGEGADSGVGGGTVACRWWLDKSDGRFGQTPQRLPDLRGLVDVVRPPGSTESFALGRDRQAPTRLVVLPPAPASSLASRAYTGGNNQGIEPVSIAADGADLVLLGQRSTAGTAGGGGAVLWKVAADGNISWTREYFSAPFAVRRVTVTKAGYLISGYAAPTNTAHFLHVDRDGNLRWAREYPGVSLLAAPSADVAAGGNSLLVAIGVRAGGLTVPALLQLGLDGSSPTACLPGRPGEVGAEPLRLLFEPIDVGTREVQQAVRPADFRDFPLAPFSGNCPATCLAEEICDNQEDDDGDGLTDCADPDVASDCCCRPVPTVELGPDTSICAGELPVLRVRGDFATVRWSAGGTGDSLRIREPGAYWVTVTDSCGRTATDTLTLHPRPRPPLDLGPDTTVCQHAAVPLEAPAGFAAYRWVDGTTDRRFTAPGAGTYWVEATDSCGGVQTDTVRVRLDPATEIELGPDRTLCAGDTLVFSVPGFTDYRWSRSSYLDCFDCPEVRFAPDRDTLLVVAATAGPGCVSGDSVRIRVEATTGERIEASICPGDCYAFGGDCYASGQYFLTRLSPTGCPVTDTLNLTVLAGGTRRDTLTVCAGDSALIFGNYERTAGTYRRDRTDAAGCDSSEIVVLDVVTIDLELPAPPSVTARDSVTIVPVTNARQPLLHWRTSTGVDCIACPRFTFLPRRNLTVYATTLGDCPAVDSVTVRVTPATGVYLPTAFSPNDDGRNDRFPVFAGPEAERVIDFAVYDRWGGQQFRAGDFDPAETDVGWDGRRPNGEPLPPGVYVYRIKILLRSGETIVRAGGITLLR